LQRIDTTSGLTSYLESRPAQQNHARHAAIYCEILRKRTHWRELFMSYISNTLDELLAASKLTAAELATAGGVSAAHISRIRSGIQAWVSSKELTTLAGVFAKRIVVAHPHAIHAQLLFARLQDECVGPGARHIAMELRNQAKSIACDVALEPKPVLPPRMQQNLDIIAEHIKDNRHVRDFIENIANLCRSSNLT
jgi:transcriptional regulator with XRE-family HTH domain